MKHILLVVAFLIVLSSTAKAQTVPSNTNDLIYKDSISVSPWRSPHYYTWEPAEDITAYELAIVLKTILPALTCRNVLRNGCDILKAIDNLPPNVKRHFVKHEPN